MGGAIVPSSGAPAGDGPVAFVLSSGANMGAVQVGVLRALVERGIRPDLIVGCSIGALNGAFLAQDPTPEGVARLGDLWCSTDGRRIMRRPRLPPALALVRRGEAMVARDGLRELIHRTLAAPSFADLEVPLHCLATDVERCAEAWFSEGRLVDALLASAAMPAMFPPVTIGGRRYIDGAVVVEVPIRRAVALGARTVYVCEVGPLTTPIELPTATRPLAAAIAAHWIARRHRFQRELDAVPDDVVVHLMPHGDPPRLRLGDFSRSGDLIAAAYEASATHLAGGPPVTGHPRARWPRS